MKRTLALFGALAVALPLSFQASAQEGTLKKIKDSGAITIGHRDASLPFSYYDDKQQPIGFAMDLCMRIVDAVRTELKLPKLDVKYQLVTSANRIPLTGLGILQYVAPILQLGCGVLIFHEPMPPARLAGFGLVWLALSEPLPQYVREKPSWTDCPSTRRRSFDTYPHQPSW